MGFMPYAWKKWESLEPAVKEIDSQKAPDPEPVPSADPSKQDRA